MKSVLLTSLLLNTLVSVNEPADTCPPLENENKLAQEFSSYAVKSEFENKSTHPYVIRECNVFKYDESGYKYRVITEVQMPQIPGHGTLAQEISQHNDFFHNPSPGCPAKLTGIKPGVYRHDGNGWILKKPFTQTSIYQNAYEIENDYSLEIPDNEDAMAEYLKK